MGTHGRKPVSVFPPGRTKIRKYRLRSKDPTVTDWATTWIRTTKDQKMVPAPPIDFFENMPDDAPCLMSDRRGSAPMSLDQPLPSWEWSVWSVPQIHETAVLMKQKFPEVQVKQPFKFEDLYQYFDAYDIYQHGAWNLWRVLLYMVDRENVADGTMATSVAWVQSWMSEGWNSKRLCDWTPAKGDILGVLSERDWKRGNVRTWDERRRDQLRRNLHRHHDCSWPGPEGFVDDDGTFYKGHGKAPFEAVWSWMDAVFMGIEVDEASLWFLPRDEAAETEISSPTSLTGGYFKPDHGRTGAASAPPSPGGRQSTAASRIRAYRTSLSLDALHVRSSPAILSTTSQAPAMHAPVDQGIRSALDAELWQEKAVPTSSRQPGNKKHRFEDKSQQDPDGRVHQVGATEQGKPKTKKKPKKKKKTMPTTPSSPPAQPDKLIDQHAPPPPAEQCSSFQHSSCLGPGSLQAPGTAATVQEHRVKQNSAVRIARLTSRNEIDAVRAVGEPADLQTPAVSRKRGYYAKKKKRADTAEKD